MTKYVGKLLSDISWMVHDLVDVGEMSNDDEEVMVDRIKKIQTGITGFGSFPCPLRRRKPIPY